MHPSLELPIHEHFAPRCRATSAADLGLLMAPQSPCMFRRSASHPPRELMARLILHSDDFGLHSEVNRGILEAARRGALTSASVMTNGAAAEEAFEEARRLPELGVGVHLNIVRGRPLCDPESVPSLVDGSGRFFNSVATLLHKSLLGRLSLDEVHREYRQQVLRALEHGITPTHFDGEKHTHLLLPEAVSALRRLSAEFGINKVGPSPRHPSCGPCRRGDSRSREASRSGSSSRSSSTGRARPEQPGPTSRRPTASSGSS